MRHLSPVSPKEPGQIGAGGRGGKPRAHHGGAVLRRRHLGDQGETHRADADFGQRDHQHADTSHDADTFAGVAAHHARRGHDAERQRRQEHADHDLRRRGWLGVPAPQRGPEPDQHRRKQDDAERVHRLEHLGRNRGVGVFSRPQRHRESVLVEGQPEDDDDGEDDQQGDDARAIVARSAGVGCGLPVGLRVVGGGCRLNPMNVPMARTIAIAADMKAAPQP